MPATIPGRIPVAPDPRRRLDPVRIRETNDGSLFETLVSQLLQGLLTGIHGGKISWHGLPVRPGNPSTTFEMDWVTWIERTHDYNGLPGSLFLNAEATTLVLEDNSEYVANKILSFLWLCTSPGGVVGAIDRLHANPAHVAFPKLKTAPRQYLIFFSNRSERLPDATGIRALLRGKVKVGGAVLPGSDPTIECEPAGDQNEAFKVTAPDGSIIHVGIVAREKLLELTYLALALNYAKRHDLLNERFLHDLTSLAGAPALLEPMPHKVGIQTPSAPSPVRVDGKLVTFCRFSIDPFQFIRMCTVLRLVSDYAYLQRLPDGPHLEEMARDIEAGGRFPTPVLCIPADNNQVSPGQNLICHTGGAIVSPYQWHIIDGQHRAFSYYLVKTGSNVQPLDIDSYELASPHDKAAIASALFLNVNFKAIRPPIDLALAHYAYTTQWPGGMWVSKRRGRLSQGDSKLYSSRILASRFLLELSEKDTVFHAFFKYRGAKDRGKTSILSISTYLGPDFELHDPSDSSNPLAACFGTAPGASGIWTVPDPSPEALRRVWEELVDAFDSFLSDIAVSTGLAMVDGIKEIQRLVSKNNNVFVGLWRAFYWYSFTRKPTKGAISLMPKATSAKLLPWLQAEDVAGHLAGPNNRYKSGSGAITLPTQIIKLLGGD
jgi:hypothetical protein